MAKELIVSATGRRKQSIARVRMKPGSGEFVVNHRTLDEYFGRDTSKMILKQPLEVVEHVGEAESAAEAPIRSTESVTDLERLQEMSVRLFATRDLRGTLRGSAVVALAPRRRIRL